METRVHRIYKILKDSLNPYQLQVEDFTQEHMGHHGQGGGEETHIRIQIASPLFLDKTLLESHRMIHSLLRREFEDGLHALEIQILK